MFNTLFKGTIVLGNNGSSNNPMVAVWRNGGFLNVKGAKPFRWTRTDGKDAVRIYANAPYEVELISKSELMREMAVGRLASTQNGYKFYRNTAMGDVLYITYDTNQENWLDAVRHGFIDRAKQIHIPEAAAV